MTAARLVYWDDFGADGQAIGQSCSAEEAVQRQRALFPRISYLNDQEALDDFCVRHWAWIVESDEDSE